MKLLPLFLLAILWACQSSDNREGAGKAQLTGAWTNYDLTVEIKTWNNGPQDSLLEIRNPQEWERILGIRPILTVYSDDGFYYSEYRNLQDTLVYRPSGIWKIEADTLRLNQKYPSDQVSAYRFAIEPTRITFEALLDWDQDGENDDLYRGTQVKEESVSE